MWVTGLFLFLVPALSVHAASSTDVSKLGLCAPPHKLFVIGEIQKCSTDLQCADDLKCCESKSGVKVCAPPQPAFTACQHQKSVAVEIGRSIDSSVNFTPDCNEENGTFVPVQCSESKNRCWCVDDAGFEIPGTRAPLGTPINCSAPRVCPHPECRMLCPQSFQMDKSGCPICTCYDACEDIKCPRSTRCITEDVNCVTDPCPPISKCAARAIDDVDCPNGLPALVDTNKKDYFLCSLLDTIITPKCPTGFNCNVRPNKEFGVCCPQTRENILKPGQCPPLNKSSNNSCVVECSVDHDCYGDAKCCSDNCNGLCLSPLTVTPCQAQRRGSETIPGVFVPECEASGQYEEVQCFGSKCWCVDGPTGMEKYGTRRLDGALPNCSAPAQCAELKCDLQCSHGFQFDGDGCPICACHLPCEEMGCPNGCNLIELDCGEPHCPTVATCKESRSLDHPCIYGSPARDNTTRDYMLCGDTPDASICPDYTKCEPIDAEGHGFCCPLPGSARRKDSSKVENKDLHLTKPVDHFGKCPAPELNRTGAIKCGNSCTKDRECMDDEKCCKTACGLTCMPAITKTACQVQDALLKQISQTLPVLRCDAKGSYEEKQCFNGKCWCVDNLGRERPGTRTSQLEALDCQKPRDCDPQCRMLCPFDFVLDDGGCPLCECANPCAGITCSEGSVCDMVPTECVKEPCPVLPQCVSQPTARIDHLNPCTFGEPLQNETTRAVISCNQAAADQTCPVSHECVSRNPENPGGVCCQRESVDICRFPKESGPCRAAFPRWYYDTAHGQCMEFTYGGCDGNLNNFHSKALCESLCKGPSVAKPGHCSVPALDTHGTCQEECGSDDDCPGSSKCCSNGCGHVCSEGAFETACDQQKSAFSKMARFGEASAKASLFVPQCLPGGAFEPVQCDSKKEACWCVDDRGQELDGTRRRFAANVTCSKSDAHHCDDVPMCRMDCPFGFLRNQTDGCPLCDCVDECDNYECPTHHVCIAMELTSIHGAVSRVPMCAPERRPSTTCAFGEPLLLPETNQPRHCNSDSVCPSTHSCVGVDGRQSGVCCSKAPLVCQQSIDVGPCRGTIPRWAFDPIAQTCRVFQYGGCQGNGNNFASPEECHHVCAPGIDRAEPLSTNNTRSNVPVADDDFCVVGKPISTFVVQASNASVELCGGAVGCPLSHTCSSHSGRTMCCPKTSDDCFLPFVSGQCSLSIPRFHFTPKTKSCVPFIYSGCDANGNNFASEAQCRNLCPVMTECEAHRPAAVQIQKISDVPVFIPDCDEYDGSWLPVQCMPAVGMCWCVDKDGHADMTTAVRGYPRCADKTVGSNVSTEFCSKEDSVQLCDPQLCRHQVCLGNPKAQCKIDPCIGCLIGFYDSNNEKVDCYEGLTACQREFLATMYSPNFAKLQIPPPLMAPGTRSSPNGAQIVRISPPTNTTSKLGTCPPYFALPHEGCAIDCYGDSQCPGDDKCCFAGCGYTCVPPITVATAKPGQCPLHIAEPDASSQESDVCKKECVSDTECTGSQKCCSQNKCDLLCTEAVVDRVLMPVYMPTCSIQGSYEWSQCSGEICWCVDENGGVRPETISRGQIQCNETGIVAGSVNSVCKNGKKPMVCRDSCRNATCSSRPDAFCAADPCNNCDVMFVDATGHTVDCHDACHQKMDVGGCHDHTERFYFNSLTQECRTFNYSGCEGNENNFETAEECTKRCLPVDVCQQDSNTGPCRALIDRWFYNKKTHHCEQFDYGGCQGNGNNFETKAACEARCPQLVVCPELSSQASMTTCNRSGLCEKAKCAHPLAECRVNPCTCQAEFVDKWGRHLQCDSLPTRCQHEALEHSVMADVYHPQCTAQGKYRSMQCFADHFSEKCWCVDDAGNVLDDVKFSRTERNCSVIIVDGVRVMMRFAPNVEKPELTEESIKSFINQMLNDLSNQNIVESMELIPAKHHIALSMLLRGDRAADVSYFFEKVLNRTVLPPELSLLQFQVEYERPDFNGVPDDRALSPITFLQPTDGVPQTHRPDLLPLLALLVLFVILAGLIAFFLYRRRRTGSYTNAETSTTTSITTVKALPNDYLTVPTISSGKTLEHIYESPSEEKKHFHVEAI